MSDTLRRAFSVGLFAAFVAFGISSAHADPTTTSFALSDFNGNGTIDVEEYRYREVEIFAVLDKDGNGFLVVAEIPDGYKELFPVVDTNADGKVSVREYLVFIMPRFWKADYDGDNVLSLPEVIASDRREARL